MTQLSSIAQLSQLGQSPWLDFIQRRLLDSGALQQLIDTDDVRGLTSNPAIFEQAIARTTEYDQSLQQALQENSSISTYDLFESLAVQDISAAADIFLPTYHKPDGLDGYVSIEVSPDLAYDEEATVAQALALHKRFSQPNVMIKVPGTEEGVNAFRRLTAEGINVNVTLLFSVERYRQIAQAYIDGLSQRLEANLPINRIASVASFFVSRVDSAVDALLDVQEKPQAKALQGQIAIANAKVAYGHYQNLFESEAFKKLLSAGAKPQRLLWASTGTKNPALAQSYYVDALIGDNTVNTIPPKTLDAYRQEGQPASRLSDGLQQAQRQLDSLASFDIDLLEITNTLEKEGIASFQDAFTHLLNVINEKSKNLG